MNKSFLIGKIAREPRFNETDYGSVLNVAITCSEKYKKADGEVVERFQTINAALWGRLAELYRDVGKDDLVSLEGSLHNKKRIAPNGSEVWEMLLSAKGFEVLKEAPRAARQEQAPAVDEPPLEEFSDDDVPF